GMRSIPAAAAAAAVAAASAAATAAATAAVAAPATAAATATAVAAATATSTAAAALLTGTRLVDGERPALVLLAVQGVDRRRGLVIVGHLDEAEAFAPAGRAIVDHLRAFHRAVCRKHRLKIRTADPVG